MKITSKVICIFCSSEKLYTVSPTQYRCVTCKRTFSIQKLQQEAEILDAFLDNTSINKCSQNLKINYNTVKKNYKKFRILIIDYIEKSNSEQKNSFSHYDEYYYLPHTKKGNYNYFFDSIGILGMTYEQKIYTLLLLDKFSQLKHLSPDLIDMHYYAKYLKNHNKIILFHTANDIMSKFWEFLDNFMLHFKGVNPKQFIYYLKEAEFKFNYTHTEQRTILMQELHLSKQE